MVVIGIVFGCTNIIIPEVDPELILSLVEKEKIELALLVPAVILFLIQHPKAKSTDFSSLRQIIYGASPIAEESKSASAAPIAAPASTYSTRQLPSAPAPSSAP